MPYEPINNYAMIGDMHTIALVSVMGSIDWMCLPRFDSPSVFAALLDDEKGGCYQIRPRHDSITYKQFYLPGTNVLVTRFLSDEGAAELTDFMPVSRSNSPRSHNRAVIRRVAAVRGEITFTMECHPAFNFAREGHETSLVEGGAIFRTQDLELELITDVPLRADDDGVSSVFSLRAGETASFILRQRGSNKDAGIEPPKDDGESAFRETVSYWREWLANSKYKGRWREMVERSALALKLLTYEPTGAIVAAPTCSLPELIGGERNWDYRYTWTRDAAFTVYSFLRLGFTLEAERFIKFITLQLKRSKSENMLQVMYNIDGREGLNEETLDHLKGYRESRPVRVGNEAEKQLQLDIYGEFLDAIYLFDRYGAPISYELWLIVEGLVNWVCESWQRPDSGIWEVRGGPKQFVYSKLMCWVAIDRALCIADVRSFPCDHQRWQAVRDEIFRAIMTKGWNDERKAFVQSFDGSALDASSLMMVLTRFVSPIDPRILDTVQAILKTPEDGGLLANHLVFRYNLEDTDDGLDGKEGTFNICTFWLVEALTRAGQFDKDKLDDARLMFERMLGFSNHVGLFAEQTALNGEGLGNFPQAFTHLALISAAVNLDRALGDSP